MQIAHRILMAVIIVGLLIAPPTSGWAKDAIKAQPSVQLQSPVKAQATGVVKSAKPDLVVSNINYSPGAPVEGNEITLWVFVKNVGQAPSGASGVRVKVGGESNPPVIPVPALNPSQQFSYEKKITFNNAGNYTVTITADAANAVVESNENNNVMSKSILVKAAPKPDLIISKINVSPGTPNKGQQFTFWVFVKNLGPGASKPSYLSTTTSSSNFSNWGVKYVPALPPGQEWRWEGLGLSVNAGTYTVRAVIDKNNIVPETNENNNQLDRAITIKP
jgi:subtilase family serine protease